MIDYVNFLSQLGDDEKQVLLDLGVRKHFMKDETICALGRESEEIFLLIAGRVKLYEVTADGKEVILWYCAAGELFGLPDVIVANQLNNRLVNAMACGYAEVLCVNYRDFLQYINRFPSVALPLIQLLSFRLREVVEVLTDITCSDVTSRVVKLLLRLSGRHGKQVDEGIFLELPVTHQEMADMIGASRQTVTTVLGDLKRRGLIQVEQRTLFIRNSEWLCQFLSQASGSKQTPIGERQVGQLADESLDIGV